MPLKLLQHKSWHVYNQENVARVQRDEARAAAQEAEDDQRTLLADSEARLDRMRKRVESKKRKRDRSGDEEAERALERQLRGEKGREGEHREDKEEEEDVRAVIVRPPGYDAETRKETGREGKRKKVQEAPMTTNGHLNFWAELEASGQPGSAQLEARLKKVQAVEPDDSLTKVYLAKRGEGEPVGWYASRDGKTERERKEPIETTLERTYRDNESKRFSDPLALMNSYLQRREDVLGGKHLRPNSATRMPGAGEPHRPSRRIGSSATPSAGDAFEPVLPLLPPRKHERSRHRPPPSPPSASAVASTSRNPPNITNATATAVAVEEEAATRVSSERARAAALLAAAAARRQANARTLSALSPSSSSPGGRSTTALSTLARSEAGGQGGWGWYNREAVREAKEARREAVAAREGGRPRDWGRSGGGGGGGWAERKERRQERERIGASGQGGGPRRDFERR